MNEKKKKNEIWEWIKALLIALGLAAIIRVFFFTPIVVDGESMLPTLDNLDHMIVNKIGYTIGEPDRFDIIVFHAEEQKDFIKRVIGLPGDEIEYKDDVLFINGKAYEEPYLVENKAEVPGSLLTENFTLEDKIDRKTVPAGTVFVLGDNRRESKDSRVIGVVPIDEIIGSTKVVFWPLNGIRIVK